MPCSAVGCRTPDRHCTEASAAPPLLLADNSSPFRDALPTSPVSSCSGSDSGGLPRAVIEATHGGETPARSHLESPPADDFASHHPLVRDPFSREQANERSLPARWD